MIYAEVFSGRHVPATARRCSMYSAALDALQPDQVFGRPGPFVLLQSNPGVATTACIYHLQKEEQGPVSSRALYYSLN